MSDSTAENSPESAPVASAAAVVAKSSRGAAVTAAAGLLGRAAGLLTTLIVTHFLSKTEYGHANAALVLATLLGYFALFSPQQALMTRDREFDAAARLVHGWSVYSGIVVAALLVAGGPLLLLWLGQPEAAPLLGWFALSLWLERLAAVPAIELRYHLRFSSVVRVDLLGDLCYVTVTIGLALSHVGPACIAIGNVARHLGRALYFARLDGVHLWPRWPRWSRRGQSPSEPTPATYRRLAGEIWRYSLPVHLGGVAEILTLYLDNLIVGALYLAAGQGLYAVSYTMIMTPCDTVALYATTALIRALGLDEAEARRRAYLAGLRYVCLVLFPVAVGGALIAPAVEKAVLPERWHGLAAVLTGLCGAAMSVGIFRLSFVQLTSLHRPVTAFVVDFGRLVFFLLGIAAVYILDGGRQHLPWVAWAVSGGFVLSALFGLFISARADELPLRAVLSALAPSGLGTAFMGGGVYLLRGLLERTLLPPALCLVVEIAAGALLYVAYLRVFHPTLVRDAVAWLRNR